MADRIGAYQVLGKLGAGAHSTILHIRRSADSRQYALKVVPVTGPEDTKYLEQAKHEFRVGQMLNHPSLIKVVALETDRDWLFRVKKVNLLIEYVNGQTLDTFPRLSLPRLLQIFAKTAAGLVHMHRRGVYHADLKPNNIMISRVGDVKIIDYGLAWIKGEPKGRIQGTPEYLAPETASQSVVNERTDTYNFGATMYRLVSWRLAPPVMKPDGQPVEKALWHKHFRKVQSYAPKAPPELCELIHQCLAFDSRERPARMGDVQTVLDELVEKLVRKPEDQLDAIEWEQ